MIRTLHVINGLGAGGAERSLAELLPELPKHGVEPSVVVFLQPTDGVEEDVRRHGIEIHHVQSAGWGGRIRGVRRLIKEQDADVVHTTIFEADVIGRLAALGTGARVLTSLVNTSYDAVRLDDPNVGRLRFHGTQAIDATTAGLMCDHFHAITEAVRQSAVRHLHLRPSRVTVIPRGRDRRRLGEPSSHRRSAVRERLDIPDRASVVLHVGREEFQKGHVFLLDALAPMFDERPELIAVLAGRSGNATPEIERRLATLPDHRIKRLGHVDEVPDLLAAADVFAFPSLYEGLGGAALEAMAMEVPVVASDLPAVREVLGGVATFVQPASATALRRALGNVLADPGAQRDRVATGRQRFDARFEHHHIATAMAQLLARCADPAGAH